MSAHPGETTSVVLQVLAQSDAVATQLWGNFKHSYAHPPFIQKLHIHIFLIPSLFFQRPVPVSWYPFKTPPFWNKYLDTSESGREMSLPNQSQNGFWKAVVLGSDYILILYSKTVKWGEQASNILQKGI